jgi:hypothetical protein
MPLAEAEGREDAEMPADYVAIVCNGVNET